MIYWLYPIFTIGKREKNVAEFHTKSISWKNENENDYRKSRQFLSAIFECGLASLFQLIFKEKNISKKVSIVF